MPPFSGLWPQSGKGAPDPIETTVTFLEMNERPLKHASAPVNVSVALMQAARPPLHFYRYLYFQIGHRWNWEARLRLGDDQLRKIIHADSTEITVLYLDGAPAGYFEINRANPLATDLAYFGMMEHAHGRGLGRWFLSAAIQAAWEHNAAKVTVNTCTLDHPAALSLYQKLGFVPIRQASGRIFPLSENELARLAISGVMSADNKDNRP